jgi:hypothetical protein
LAKTLSITSRLEACERSRRLVGGRALLRRCQERRAAACEPRAIGDAPEALVGDEELGLGAGEQVGERLVLLLVRRHERVAERQAAPVGDQHEPDAVDIAVL